MASPVVDRRRLACPTCGADRVVRDESRSRRNYLLRWAGVLLSLTVVLAVIGLPLWRMGRWRRYLFCKSCGYRFVMDRHGMVEEDAA